MLTEEKTKQSPAEAHCMILVAKLRDMKAERDAALNAKFAAIDAAYRYRRRFVNLLVAVLIVGAIGVGACLAEAAKVVR
jgi:hypothetical protein